MRLSTYVSIFASLQVVQAISLSDVADAASSISVPSVSDVKRTIFGIFTKAQDQCPPVWSEIYTQLVGVYLADGQCTDAARAAIRLAFHDCFSGGKCDGSIILGGECSRPENNGLAQICGNLGNLATQRNVGVADLIQFAGATAIAVCPMGPRIPAYVGRKDSSTPSPEGDLPGANESADQLIARFAAKGFNSRELVALVGAHSTAKQRFVDPSKAGAALDQTPGTWDVKFYGNTLTNTAPFTLQSDKNLATSWKTAMTWMAFGVSQPAWSLAFTSAMTKMSLMGVEGGARSLTDCSSVIRRGTQARDVKSSGINGRAV